MNEFITSDMTLAATLVAIDFGLHRIDSGNTKSSFVFESTPELEKAIADFHARKMVVIPQDFHSALRSVKNRLYDATAGY